MPRLAIPNCLLPQHLFYFILFCFLQASQLGVYRAFVDNYEVAMETAEKCCQANAQFAEISEVISWYSDTRDIWIWLVPCNVTPVYSPSIFATLTSEGVMNSLSFSLCSCNNLYFGLIEVILWTAFMCCFCPRNLVITIGITLKLPALCHLHAFLAVKAVFELPKYFSC